MGRLVCKSFRYVLNAYEYDDSEFQDHREITKDEVFNFVADIDAEVDNLRSVTSPIPMLRGYQKLDGEGDLSSSTAQGSSSCTRTSHSSMSITQTT